ncbi:MAG: putative solute-binding periplasmic protein of ABC transport [Candidatus Gallionella acididurans]|uniref:Putative solute-binding periplasmic protein of ABC transport n=1 Tax=Candidatus Gallionella acididurans TaxID=1796491 RepID=A0A139BW22_9PROT|nr:MAG: putative solute-binding periplasmic protein of ABC transport [Candidatus Gallionella acididurans]
MKISKLVLLVCSLFLTMAVQAEPDVVRLGNLKFAHYGAVSYMKELAPKYNLVIEERMFAKGLDILPATIAGEIDIAASALDAAVAGRASGVPIYVVAGFAKGGARIVARPDLNIRSVADLRGRRVGVARGGAQELLLYAELSKYNLTWSDQPGKDVQIFFMPFADLNQALMQKNIDAMSQSEPQSSQAINKGYGVEVLKPYDTPLGEPVRVLVMTEKMYNEKRDVAQRVLKLFVEATRAFQKDPKLAEKYVREQMFKSQISDQDYRDAMSNASFTYDVSLAHVQITADLMKKYGVGKLGYVPQAKDWVRLDLLDNAKKALQVK